jgi:hypothetical protein
MYGWSVLHCLPATLAEHPVEATGTVLRASTVARWADAAGFTGFDVLPIDTPSGASIACAAEEPVPTFCSGLGGRWRDRGLAPTPRSGHPGGHRRIQPVLDVLSALKD